MMTHWYSFKHIHTDRSEGGMLKDHKKLFFFGTLPLDNFEPSFSIKPILGLYLTILGPTLLQLFGDPIHSCFDPIHSCFDPIPPFWNCITVCNEQFWDPVRTFWDPNWQLAINPPFGSLSIIQPFRSKGQF